MNLVSYSPDKFGYYTVGDYKTYSKLEAIELQKSTGHFPEWNFNREIFNRIDWKKEPSVDLWELYKERARQISSNYDYIILFYSGGGDSYNMIDSWISSGARIDEVATFWNYSGSKDRNDFGNAEINQVVLKEIPKFQQRSNFKFRLIDMSEFSLDYLNEENDLVYQFNMHLCPHRLCVPSFRSKIKEYADIIASGKKLCFVWGADKPQLFFDGEHYVQFFDILGTIVNPKSQENYHNGWFDELFYWSPDMPEIVLKQAHVIKRFLKVCNDTEFYQQQPNPFGYNPNIQMYLKKTSFVQLLYPNFNCYTFSTGKNPSKLLSLRDNWILESNLQEKDKLRETIKSYISKINPYWLNDETDYNKGIKRHASPKYYL